MNFGELKTYLTTLINRKDVPNALAGQFINQSIDRLTKVLRPPFLQTVSAYSFNTATEVLSIPPNFIELMNLVSTETELAQVDMSTLVRKRAAGGAGKPEVFCKIAGDFYLYPPLEANTVLTLHYYRATNALVADTDENGWTTAALDAVIYGAAELAADFYEDDRGPRFAAKYNTSLIELQAQAYEDQFSGPMSIAPAYNY